VSDRQIVGGHCSAAAEGQRSIMERLANVDLQLHVAKAGDEDGEDGAITRDAFGSIESPLTDIFQAAVEPPSSCQAAGTVVHPQTVLCWTRVLTSLTHRDLALYRACQQACGTASSGSHGFQGRRLTIAQSNCSQSFLDLSRKANWSMTSTMYLAG
jgi:hypothetical protein